MAKVMNPKRIDEPLAQVSSTAKAEIQFIQFTVPIASKRLLENEIQCVMGLLTPALLDCFGWLGAWVSSSHQDETLIVQRLMHTNHIC